MSANFEAKKELVSEIKDKIQRAKSFVVVDYRGMTVAQDTELRAGFIMPFFKVFFFSRTVACFVKGFFCYYLWKVTIPKTHSNANYLTSFFF